jgi:glutamate carboxypeptidase
VSRRLILWSVALVAGAAWGGSGHVAARVAAQAGSIEARIVRAVDQDQPAALGLLERVVNINSGTMNLTGVRAVGDVFRSELDALGFETRWVDGTAFKRAGHLVAVRAGAGPRVLLIGHLDTVFETDSPFQRFERLSPTTARGPGVIDMKGGDVILVFALRALARAGVLDRLAITIVMNGDEEDPGEPVALARRALREAADGAVAAIGFEDGDGDPGTAVISRRGFTNWTLRSKGLPAHSSQVFTEKVGAGAIYEAARVINGFYDRLSGEALLSVNPGLVLGGTAAEHDLAQSRGTAFGKSNVVAGTAVVTGDIRAFTPAQLAAAKQTMRQVASAGLPHTTSELTFDDSYPPMAPTDGNRHLLAMYDEASRDLGLGAVTATDPRAAGAADVSFVAAAVQEVIDGIGLMGTDDHTTRETADLTTLGSQTKRAALLLARLSGGVAR